MAIIVNGRGRVGVRVPSGAPAPSIVTNGLILNLDAGNPASYPGTGTVWTDLSPSAKNGTLYNGVSYSSDNGGTLVFDGTNDFVSRFQANIFSLNPDNGITNETWVYVNNANRAEQNWFGMTSYGLISFNFGINSSRRFKWTMGVNGTYVYNGYNLDLNSWKCITFTGVKEAGVIVTRIYVNGTYLTSYNQPNTTFNSVSDYLVGSGYQYQDYINAKIPITRLYNRALSASEVTQNYNALKSRYGL